MFQTGIEVECYEYHTNTASKHIPDSDGHNDDDILGCDDNNGRLKDVYIEKVLPVSHTNCAACFLSSAQGRSILQSMISVSVESRPLGAAGRA